MRRALQPLGIELIGLTDLGNAVPQVDESGRDPLENAKLKAKAYYTAFGVPVFSCDSGLYFDGLSDDEQPGTHIRRVGGRELTDEEMIGYYSALVAKHGGRLVGRYRNAVCLILSPERVFTCFDSSLENEPFALVTEPHAHREKGFPLDSLSVDLDTDRYFYDMPERTVDKLAVGIGFRNYFAGILDELM